MKKVRRSRRKKPKAEDMGRGIASRTSNEGVLLTQDDAGPAEAETRGVSIQEILGGTAGQSVSEGSDDDQQAVVPSQTGKEVDNEAGQLNEDTSQEKNAQVVFEVVVPETVPAMTPSTRPD